MKIRLGELINSGLWRSLDWIYPPDCASCGEPGYRLCPECQAKIRFIRGKRCALCGEPTRGAAERCKPCQVSLPPYTAMRNLAYYEGVIRDCVHALKYQHNQGLGEYFSGMLASLVREAGWAPDLVMPVPLSAQRMAQRGFNQAACLARPLAAHLGVRYHPYGIMRTRDTPSQVGLSGEARRRNVAGAFTASTEVVAGRKVLIVDDVMTTGSTMETSAGALREAGADAVYCLTLGRFALRAGLHNLHRHQV